jgi:hypothetical protein
MKMLELGFPLGVILAGATAVTGAAQAAAIAAQSPPQLWGGGGSWGDGYPAILHGTPSSPETVVDQRTTRDAGGPAGVRRMLDGGPAQTVDVWLPGAGRIATGIRASDRRSPEAARRNREAAGQANRAGRTRG